MTHVHPTRDDRVVAAVSEVVGGPVGEHATRHRWWTPTRVLLALTAVVFSLGMLQKAPCSVGGAPDQEWVYSHMCYTDLRPLYVGRGLAERAWPYSADEQTRDRYEVMEYPVGIAYWAYGASWLTQLLNGSPDLEERYRQPVDELHADRDVQREHSIFVLVNAVGFALLALLATWLLARVNPGRPWDAAAFALSPALALTGLINWDLLAVALVAGALWAWSRDRPVLTGVLIGLGTAAKLYPLFLLGGILVICLRQRRYAAFGAATLAAALAWAVTNLPAVLSGPDQWKVFWTFNADRGADLGSVWLVVDQAGDLGITAATINTWSWVVFGGWCLGVLVLGLLAGRRAGVTPGWRSSGSSSSSASCSSTRSTRRSTCCGCCRWRCWPGRAGATS
ncbi:glycosyltransferase 87 family protein [Nocardioides sp. TF02-7]|uniref:glycosyltransferase 87 family protein n=1 Tax=Nocardioides sp. TF02-7 TaxID=2917724 RepID=UPI001F055955|nr:glycosyltransferase 87 family protein [Nocardioides sp. TF02-7]UMG94202.1 glycosyltransferase 87 family protein [Nocardioides sp. TF02-7]